MEGKIGYVIGSIAGADLSNPDYVVLTKEVAIKREERFKGEKKVRVKITDAVKNQKKY